VEVGISEEGSFQLSAFRFLFCFEVLRAVNSGTARSGEAHGQKPPKKPCAKGLG
jgi:hypothetical protein